MPFDITDAKEQIEELTTAINYMYAILKDNGLIPEKEEPTRQKLTKVE